MPPTIDEYVPKQKFFPDAQTVRADAAAMHAVTAVKESVIGSIVDLSTLSPDQRKIVAAYSLYDAKTQLTPEWKSKEAQNLQILVDFLKNPAAFKPSPYALRRAYDDLVRKTSFRDQPANDLVVEQALKMGFMRNVSVKVSYESPTMSGSGGCVLTLSAEVNKLKQTVATSEGIFRQADLELMQRSNEDAGWEAASTGYISFTLDDWVQKI